MAKRGKYRRYNGLWEKGSKKIKLIEEKDVSTKFSTEHARKIAGKGMYDRVAAERYRHYIGEKVILNRFIEKNEREKTVGGVVVGLYPHFVLVDCGNYKTSVTYTDLVLGGKKYAYD